MSSTAQDVLPEVRYRIRVRGQVQGVGFRPFVFRLATELGLAGWVHNDGQGVAMEVQGVASAVDELLVDIEHCALPLARIDAIERQPAPLHRNCVGFGIETTADGGVRTQAPPDAGVCRLCLEEIFDAADRRYRYAFTSCTSCGPRYTITRALPFDRDSTTMADFRMCADCRVEYGTASDRRFHAQANACAACGPRLKLLERTGAEIAGRDVIVEALRRIRAGEVIALKGLGGFHLACDAHNATAVNRLRMRKARDSKPFAVMAANIESASRWVACSQAESELVHSPARPIVLLRKRPACDRALPGVAPGLASLGVMLPYTPLHYLVFHEAAGRPGGADWLDEEHSLLLVMTSANVSADPLVIDNAEAIDRLAGLADCFIVHDRDIYQRCDDSVLHCDGRSPGFIRRGRGHALIPIKLPHSGPSVLACGAFYKNTICLTREDEAFVSQHIGDLESAGARRGWDQTLARLQDILAIEPEIVAHDLHPDFYSTRRGLRIAAEAGLPCIGVQHHHAHVAAVAAEHHLEGPAIGLALDGVGLGSDGGAWGGELLRVAGADVERLGHLAPLALPGGDRAAREPWRMAASALHALGRAQEIPGRFPSVAGAAVQRMLASGFNCPPTSSAGRLFDAAAGLLGVAAVSQYEGHAAMLLESASERHGPGDADAQGYGFEADGSLTLLPLLARLTDLDDAGEGAALFHATLIDALSAWVERAALRETCNDVVLAGGCFLNRLLCAGITAELESKGFKVHAARRVPPNDGGVSLGQAWVALSQSAA